MGTYNKGILGPFRGKVGPVIGYSWRGKDLMRGLPKESTVAATKAQLEQRAKFGTVIKFLTPIKGILSAYFGKEQKAKSPFNLATGYHLNEALLPGPDDTWLIDYPKVLISRGDLRGVDNPQLAVEGGLINLTWTDNSGLGSADATDLLIAVVYCTEMNEFVQFNPAATRADAVVQLAIPAYLSGSLAEVWVTFATAEGNLAAVSSYAGAVTVP
ncbi:MULTISPECIES: DUF6266 family protein [Aequorivita]|uniref:Phage tail protein n=1 Tax=Aequorivita iocasae TaxID=2803865 RepID=A0ABX7DQJ3_9FLAO|nr:MULTISPECIES: DUF6266 family protein [Aequorivita]QQX76401.1 hypothetical protein JK629_13905 [Aequorivita iocasae]UCA55871.1 DUF6266 family protein [Aequorivita sp. F7]